MCCILAGTAGRIMLTFTDARRSRGRIMNLAITSNGSTAPSALMNGYVLGFFKVYNMCFIAKIANTTCKQLGMCRTLFIGYYHSQVASGSTVLVKAIIISTSRDILCS